MLRLHPFVLACAVGCTPPVLSSDEHAIIGGSPSNGAGATVMLVGYPPDKSVIHTCTAVLITPTVLLTAAHCIDAPTHPSYSYGVFAGDDATAYPFLVDLEPHLRPVTNVYPHPQYSPTLPFYADLGAVLLAQPLAATPLPIRRTPLDSSIIGTSATIIGYGQTTYQQPNRRRYEATTTVTAIENDTLVIGDTQKRSCLGDSGGPAIVDGTVIAIDSYGPLGCTDAAHYRRVDSFLPFIEGFAPPPASGTDAGTGPGPDAPTDEVDEGGCTTGGGAGWLLALFVAGFAASHAVRRRARLQQDAGGGEPRA